jgi:integrase/recombinase XerD
MILLRQQGDGIMFESLFARPSAIAQYRSAPLLKERLRYLAHCEQIGIKPETLRKIASHQLVFVRALDLQDGDDGLTLSKIEAWYRRWSSPEERTSRPRAGRRFFSRAERWLRFVGWRNGTEAAGHAHTREVTAFAAHVSGECGWSDATIESCCRTVNRFFFWLDDTGVDLASVEITMIDQVIANFHARGYCRSTIHL